ncbi:MAG: hypothetical protein HYY02_06755 [Chloroflexi bacterium]|nr:hypothetical protein [Chloroflexota bacterium]
MTQDAAAPAEGPASVSEIEQLWVGLEPGQKARAMRQVYEEQQKLVVEIQRLMMEKETEIAVAVARARAAEDLQQEEQTKEIIEAEVKPRQQELEDMERQRAEAQALLDAFVRIGRGII